MYLPPFAPFYSLHLSLYWMKTLFSELFLRFEYLLFHNSIRTALFIQSFIDISSSSQLHFSLFHIFTAACFYALACLPPNMHHVYRLRLSYSLTLFTPIRLGKISSPYQDIYGLIPCHDIYALVPYLRQCLCYVSRSTHYSMSTPILNVYTFALLCSSILNVYAYTSMCIPLLKGYAFAWMSTPMLNVYI